MNSAFIRDIKSYNFRTFTKDFVSGLVVAVIVIPQGLAYSIIAGMPPVYGLYASLVPMIIFALFTSARYTIIGPVAIMSIVVLSGVSSFAEPGSASYINKVLMVALMSGIFQLIFALLRLGSLSNFLSYPVMTGFISAAGIIIIISQIKHLFSLDVQSSGEVIEMLRESLMQLSNFNLNSAFFGLGGLLLLLSLKYFFPKSPYYIFVVVLGTLVFYFLRNSALSVPIIGDIPGQLPSFSIAFLDAENFLDLVPTALVVSIVCFIGSFSISKTLQDTASSKQRISANQELLSLGAAKILGSFFLAMPSTASFSRSAINYEMGARTTISGIITALIIALILSSFSSIFYFLPLPILAAIVIVSVLNLIRVAEVRRLYHQDRMDFWILIATFLLTITLGIVNGIIAGIILSLLSVIIRVSKPHFAELGRLPGTDSYRNVNRYEDAIVEEDILILRYDQDLFFGNAEHFYRSILAHLEKRAPLKKFVLHVGGINNIDSTAMKKLIELNDYCTKNSIKFELTDVRGPIRDKIYKSDFYRHLGKDKLHLSVAHAVLDEDDQYAKEKNLSLKYSNQSDLKER